MGRKYKVVRKKPILFVDDDLKVTRNVVGSEQKQDDVKVSDARLSNLVLEDTYNNASDTFGAEDNTVSDTSDDLIVDYLNDNTDVEVEEPVEIAHEDVLFNNVVSSVDSETNIIESVTDDDGVLGSDNVNEFGDVDDFVVPDKFIVGLPEDVNLPPMLYFYKSNKIILAYPLSQENLAVLHPVLDGIYIKPVKKTYSWSGFTKWLKKHKFTAGVLIILAGLLLFSLTSATLAGFGL